MAQYKKIQHYIPSQTGGIVVREVNASNEIQQPNYVFRARGQFGKNEF